MIFTKIEVITKILAPKYSKDVRIILGHVGFYRRFIEKFTKVDAPLFKLLAKYAILFW